MTANRRRYVQTSSPGPSAFAKKLPSPLIYPGDPPAITQNLPARPPELAETRVNMEKVLDEDRGSRGRCAEGGEEDRWQLRTETFPLEEDGSSA